MTLVNRPGIKRAGAPMRVIVTSRRPLPGPVRAHAEERAERLGRHAQVHEVAMVIDHDERGLRPCSVELVVHVHHVRLVAHAEGATVQEAVDRATDKADRQVLRRKDRVTHRKGQVGADGLPGEKNGETTSVEI
jgi:ribosomal subunit interface protein